MASSVVRKCIFSPNLPQAAGSYSPGVLVDRTLYISGVIGNSVATNGAVVAGGVLAEAKQVFENMGHVLTAAGLTYKHVVKTTIYLTDINDFSQVDQIYKSVFTENYPARATFQVVALPKGAKIEVEGVAIAACIHDVKA